MKQPQVTKKKVLWEGRFLRVISVEFNNSHGKKFDWEAIERKNIKGIVAVVPITEDQRVVLLKQFRPPVGMYVIEFPAGLNDKDESSIEVAERELLEETGYKPSKMEFLIQAPLSSGASSEKMDVFLATGCKKIATQDLEEVEIIEVIEIPLKNFYSVFLGLKSHDTILDPKVPGLLEIARYKGLI